MNLVAGTPVVCLVILPSSSLPSGEIFAGEKAPIVIYGFNMREMTLGVDDPSLSVASRLDKVVTGNAF